MQAGGGALSMSEIMARMRDQAQLHLQVRCEKALMCTAELHASIHVCVP